MSPARKEAPLERTCRRCDTTKLSAEFTTDKGVVTTLCRACSSELGKERYANNSESEARKQRSRRAKRMALDPDVVASEEHVSYWQKKKRDPVGYTLARLRSAAKQKGLAFDLEREDIFVPEFCPILGLRLAALASGRGREDAPECDRLDARLGYVRGNVMFVSHRANRIKNDGSAAEHERIAAWMRSRGGR